MQGSAQRIRRILAGQKPDRIALYDLLRNDAVLEHFAGRPLTFENSEQVVYTTFREAIDATRPKIRLPQRDRHETLPDGRVVVHQRWTSWVPHRRYESQAAYVQAKQQLMRDRWDWSSQDQQELDVWIASQSAIQQRLGDECFLFWSSIGSPGLMGLFEEVGLEEFSYLLHDAPEIIAEQIDFHATKAVQKIERIPTGTSVEAVFLGEDMAFKTGILFPLSWMRKAWLPHLHRILAAYHARGIKVIFHSDGDLNAILDDLVDAGIDILNPIEIAAGMDVAAIHRRHPRLLLAGGIDVSGLLPFGTPREVADTVHKAIDDAEGRILVGSSTELLDSVPLRNFLAMRDAVMRHGT